MRRIQFAESDAVQPLIGTHAAEFRAAEYRDLPLGDLEPLYATTTAHAVLPARPRSSPISTNLILSYLGQRVPGMPRPY